MVYSQFCGDDASLYAYAQYDGQTGLKSEGHSWKNSKVRKGKDTVGIFVLSWSINADSFLIDRSCNHLSAL